MVKEFEIQGCITVKSELSQDEFWDLFIKFVEDNNWSFGGGINEIVDGYYVDPDCTQGKCILDKNEQN